MSVAVETTQKDVALKRLEKAVQDRERALALAQQGYITMAKAVTTSNIANVVPQDLERETYNALWDIRHANVLMALKLIPTQKATQIVHEFSRLTSYGQTRGMGFVNETSIPQASDPVFQRRTVNIKLLAALAEVFQLAQMEQTISVGGHNDAVGIAKWTVLHDFLWRTNRAFYYSDTRTQRLGEAGSAFKGLIQQIEEGTDGTVDTSIFGSHVIDMEGQPLTPTTLRQRLLRIVNYFGAPTCLITSPEVRADFEARLDAAGRISLPVNGNPFVLGQRVGGFRMGDVDLAFHTDLQMGPYHGQGRYVAVAQSGAPAIPTATGTNNAVASGSNVSKFDANTKGAGDVFYMITEVKNGQESLGRRVPSSGVYTVVVGGEVAFSLQASDPTSDSFRIYRGTRTNGVTQANTEAEFAFEVANSTDGTAVTAYDLNRKRPGLHTAMCMDIASPAHDYFNQLQTGQLTKQMSSAEQAETFGNQSENMGNTIARARLGPEYGTMELAPYALHAARPVMFTAQAPEVRAPSKNLVFINIAPTVTTV